MLEVEPACYESGVSRLNDMNGSVSSGTVCERRTVVG